MAPRNYIYKEWVESHPRTVRALTLAPASAPSAMRANTSKKRIEINANLLFLMVPGRGTKLHEFLQQIHRVTKCPASFTRQITRYQLTA
jgi:hypothetical protein